MTGDVDAYLLYKEASGNSDEEVAAAEELSIPEDTADGSFVN